MKKSELIQKLEEMRDQADEIKETATSLHYDIICLLEELEK